MRPLDTVTNSDLKMMYRSALFLREKLTSTGRAGSPLAKLLNREIDIINDELSDRKLFVAATITQEVPVVKAQ
ncbi:MAG: hypothetical protein RLP44_20665 [Aggregatilineales bacterium]